jgi:hypothetical protein
MARPALSLTQPAFDPIGFIAQLGDLGQIFWGRKEVRGIQTLSQEGLRLGPPSYLYVTGVLYQDDRGTAVEGTLFLLLASEVQTFWAEGGVTGLSALTEPTRPPRKRNDLAILPEVRQ